MRKSGRTQEAPQLPGRLKEVVFPKSHLQCQQQLDGIGEGRGSGQAQQAEGSEEEEIGEGPGKGQGMAGTRTEVGSHSVGYRDLSLCFLLLSLASLSTPSTHPSIQTERNNR